MSTEFFILIGAVVIGFIFLYLSLGKKLESQKTDPTLTRWLQSLQSSMNTSSQHLTTTLQASYKELHERLDRATTVIGDLKREAGTFSEIGRSMKDLQ
ncbi:hypothetical protein HYS10_01475, partial [Candidatus Collierbacteria bacterium]|nr:hypothetical protein [Candidatus Collierbacteria bacterium]